MTRKVLSMIYPVLTVSAAFLRMPSGRVHIKGRCFRSLLSYTGFGLIWNVDMLHQYQLEIPETLDEFWNVCDVLKQNGILPYGANKDFGPECSCHVCGTGAAVSES